MQRVLDISLRMTEEDPDGHNLEQSRRKILSVNMLNFELHRNFHAYLGRHIAVDRLKKSRAQNYKTTMKIVGGVIEIIYYSSRINFLAIYYFSLG